MTHSSAEQLSSSNLPAIHGQCSLAQFHHPLEYQRRPQSHSLYFRASATGLRNGKTLAPPAIVITCGGKVREVFDMSRMKALEMGCDA